ncbi:MAG: exopolysaccharide biosynthesis polyprenyl glycosylphosphotransferase [Lachnospiraceae bacterium]|nr:exopolysaccharide biosynthesis polyprenyl glycosylphosphotransferase [Lachnospiraceae bacterium]
MQKIESFKRLINLALVLGCIGLEIAIFGYNWYFHFRYSIVEDLRTIWFRGHILEISIYGVILLSFSSMYGGMRLGYLKNSEIIFSQMFATLMANVLIYAELSVMAFQLFVPDVFITMTLEQLVLVMIYIFVVNNIYRRIFPPRKLLLIHGDRPIEEIIAKFDSRKDKYVVYDSVSVKAGTKALCDRIIRDYDAGRCSAVVLWDISNEERNKIFKFCYAHSIRTYIMPKITDVILLGSEELHVFDAPILLTREYSLAMEERIVKRTIDIVFSLVLIVVTSPIMLMTAIAVKLYDGGPVLYKQTRCTRNMRRFKILKFRSMKTNAEKDGVARLSSKNDDRVTPIGKFIRKCRIDELPQLFNILKGEMSFIGPRPERPEIIEQYVEVMPEFVFRTKVKAGLAGFAQVYGKYNTSPYDKLKLDLTYIEQYSLWLDLKLMLLTLKILFWPDSTEGVEAEQITALKADYAKKRHKANDE